MSDPDPRLRDTAAEFAETTTRFLAECFTAAPPIEVEQAGSHLRLTPVAQTERRGGIPLRVKGTRLAWLRIDYRCRLDTTSEFLAIDRSKVWIVAEVDSTPLVRFEYLYDADWVPHSHIQVHGERGALSHLLSQTGHAEPHNMAALHLPTGGARFRPNLEDVVQFLATDCGFDVLPTWREAVDRERAEWRRIQVRAVSRALPEEAAYSLRRLGYTVTPPEDGPPAPGRKALRAW